jgi:hypothetical protein
MNYSFVEIGSPNGLTLISYADDTTVGLSIQASEAKLDELPNKANVVKMATDLGDISLAEIFETHEVEKIHNFYVFTENGHDANIVQQLVPIMSGWDSSNRPMIIRFGPTTDLDALDTCILSFEALGYEVDRSSGSVELFRLD